MISCHMNQVLYFMKKTTVRQNNLHTSYKYLKMSLTFIGLMCLTYWPCSNDILNWDNFSLPYLMKTYTINDHMASALRQSMSSILYIFFALCNQFFFFGSRQHTVSLDMTWCILSVHQVFVLCYSSSAVLMSYWI